MKFILNKEGFAGVGAGSLQKIKAEKSVYLSLCNPQSEKSCDF